MYSKSSEYTEKHQEQTKATSNPAIEIQSLFSLFQKEEYLSKCDFRENQGK